MGTGREKARVKDRNTGYLCCICLLAATRGSSIWFSRFSEKSPMQLMKKCHVGLKSTTPWVFKRLLKNVGHVEDPRRDIILTFKMNGEPLPADHGAPLRCLVPGVAGARSVKWLNKLIAPWHYEMSWTVGRGESRSFLILFGYSCVWL